MKIAALGSSARRLDIVAGTVDGILNALVLTAVPLLTSTERIHIDFAFRVGFASSLTTLFVFFVGHYSEFRSELLRVERELNVVEPGRLALSSLGRDSLREALVGSLVAAMCGFLGASIPLLANVVVPQPHWIGPGFTILLLGALGALLGRSTHGSAVLWSGAMMLAGVLVLMVGAWLHVLT